MPFVHIEYFAFLSFTMSVLIQGKMGLQERKYQA